jgi:hypothetical protein
MADKSTEKVQQQTVSDATDAATETVGKVTDRARRTSETAAGGYDQLSILGQDNVEGMARASQALLKGASDLGSLWASYWSEQLSTGMEAMRSLAECHGWDEAVTVQNEFARTSLERVCSQTVRSAEVTVEMLTSSLAPLQETARRAAERTHRPMA